MRGAQWLIAALVALGPFSLTMYQPALPSIATSLNITTAQVQLTLTVYLASFAIGQLIYGPLSDHFGRRRTLLLGLAIFVAGAIACALATSAAVLIAARVLQGLGACAGPALGRAMIRDLYGAKGSAKAMAFVASALSIAPAIAPVFGGYIAGAAGWPWIFATLALVGTGMFVFVLLRVPETNPYVSRGAFRFVSMLGSYLQLVKSRRYLGYLAIAAVPVAGSLSFQTAAPFIIVGELGVHPSEFGLLMVSLTAAYFVGTLVANRLAVHAGVNTVDHAWKRAATCRSRAPDGIRPEPQPIDLVGAGASDDLADGHGDRDAKCHGGSCRTVSDDGRGGGVSPGVRHDGGRSAEQLGSVTARRRRRVRLD